MQSFRPLRDNLVVLPLLEDEDPLHESSLIVIPDIARENPMRGRVVAVGPGKRDLENGGRRIPVEVYVGDIVAFGPYAATRYEVRLNGVRHVVLAQADILGLVEEGSF